MRGSIDSLLQGLLPRERNVLRMRYGLHRSDGAMMSQVGFQKAIRAESKWRHLGFFTVDLRLTLMLHLSQCSINASKAEPGVSRVYLSLHCNHF